MMKRPSSHLLCTIFGTFLLLSCTDLNKELGPGPIVLDNRFTKKMAKERGGIYIPKLKRSENGSEDYSVENALYHGMPCSCIYFFLDDALCLEMDLDTEYFLLCLLKNKEKIDSLKLVSFLKGDFGDKINQGEEFQLRIVFGEDRRKAFLYFSYPTEWYFRAPE